MLKQEQERAKCNSPGFLTLASQIKNTGIKVIYSKCCQCMNNIYQCCLPCCVLRHLFYPFSLNSHDFLAQNKIGLTKTLRAVRQLQAVAPE